MYFNRGSGVRRSDRLRIILAAESDLMPSGMEQQAEGPAKLFQHIKAVRTWADQPVSRARIERAELDAQEDNLMFQTLVSWRVLDEVEALALECGEVCDLEDGAAWGRSPAGQAIEYRLFGNESVLVTLTVAGGWPALQQLSREDAKLEELMVPAALADLALGVDNREQLLKHAQHRLAWDYIEDVRPRPTWPESRLALLEEARSIVRSARAAEAALMALSELEEPQPAPAPHRLDRLSTYELGEIRQRAIHGMKLFVDDELHDRTKGIWGNRVDAFPYPAIPGTRPTDDIDLEALLQSRGSSGSK